MPANLDQSLRDHLLAYADGQCSLVDFDRWFTTHVLTLLEQLTSDRESQRRVYSIVGELAEYDDGVWTEKQLRARLRRLANAPVLLAAS
jgi:chloramphenicol 3-O-phosphotransferase